MKIVIDSNVLFSALLSAENRFRSLLFLSNHSFYSPNFLFVEIFKCKDKIQVVSKLGEDDILTQLGNILSRIHFVSEALIPKEIYGKAYDLCRDIDEKDTPFVALSIFLDAHLLTGDRELIAGLTNKGFTTVLSIRKIEEIDKDILR